MGGGSKGRPKVGDLSHIRPTDDERHAVIDQAVESKAPIEVAILGISIIETVIDEMLRDRLSISNERHWLKLIGEGGLISGFPRKIELTYAMGLYDSVIKHNLDVARHVRNAFAHVKIPMDFSRQEIKEELDRIALPAKPQSRLRKSLKACIKTKDQQEKYLLLCLLLSNALFARRLRGLTAAVRNRARTLKKLKSDRQFPFPDPSLMSNFPSLQKLFSAGDLESSPQSHTDDPKFPLGRGLMYRPPGVSPKKPHNEGK